MKEYNRSAALSARPERLPVVRAEPTPAGKLLVTVEQTVTGWSRWFTRSGTVERTFALDALGREVYDACDGETPVEGIVRTFARNHRISLAEAEMSVTAFLKTLIQKGLIAMAVDRERDNPENE